MSSHSGAASPAGAVHGGPRVTLCTGSQLPLVAFGTYQIRADAARTSVITALRCGYRSIDTAQIYRNEELVGQGIIDAGVPRSEIFLQSKISPQNQGYEAALSSSLRSLEALQVDYIDSMIIHWPGASGLDSSSPKNSELRAGSWKALEELFHSGRARAVGVSNYTVPHLEELLRKVCSNVTKPAINQVEFHPRLYQSELLDFCKTAGIVLQAYSPLGQGDLVVHPVVQRIAKQTHRTGAQVLLQWCLDLGVSFAVKSVNEARIAENYAVAVADSQPLTKEQREALEALHDNHHYCWNPNGVR